jgi:hypothetical protein
MDITYKRTKLDPYFTPYTISYSKWIKVLIIKSKIIKLPEENRKSFNPLILEKIS